MRERAESWRRELREGSESGKCSKVGEKPKMKREKKKKKKKKVEKQKEGGESKHGIGGFAVFLHKTAQHKQQAESV